MSKQAYPKWTLIDWEGNPDLNLKCWRKSFRGGHVSVGVGDDFLTIVYSYGANSDSSYSGTRWNYDSAPISEQAAMDNIDLNNGSKMTLVERPDNWDA